MVMIQITVAEGWMPHLRAVNMSTKGDTVNNVKLKTDISVSNQDDGIAPINRMEFSRMELWMKFKVNKDGVPLLGPLG